MITIMPHTPLPAPAQETLQKFQKSHRLTLPPEYLAFLRIANCGEPVEKLFDIPGNTKVVERFLGIIEGYQTHPLGQYDAGVTHSQVCERLTGDPDQVGTTVLPIAALAFGDLLCLDFRRSPNSPSVVVWDHERSDEFAPFFIPVAPSFDAFLDMLYPSNARNA
jgi:hypothetical protein